ncbi:MAG: ribonuclease P protein component [Sedimentisphaerales bacterium]|nr:ribonuclease P protein component [Sedimentisphaerales bacterium]
MNCKGQSRTQAKTTGRGLDVPIQGHQLPRRARISGQKLIRSIISLRNRYANRLMTIYVAPNQLPFARLGVSVSKSCGKAVVRNRLKRLVREAFRLERARIPSGYDYMVILRSPQAQMPTLAQVRASLIGLVCQALPNANQGGSGG